MMLLIILFYFCLFIVFYAYVGYGILLWFLIKLRKLFGGGNTQIAELPEPAPGASLVVPCFNEADFLEEKIRNCYALDYPADRLEILFITDGSTDHSGDILKNHPRIRHMHSPERRGKIAAMHRAVGEVKHDLVIFCDANTSLNPEAIRNIIRHYSDPKVGGVAGEKQVISRDGTNKAGSGEGFYWKYESFLKKLDSAFYTVVGAAGELFSFRKELYERPDEGTILDDFILSLRVCMKGYRVVYEPAAIASEAPSFSLADERKRKIRISAGGFQSVVMLSGLLNIFKYGKASFQYISHRVLRWVVCPFLLPVILVLNIILALKTTSPLFDVLLIAQVLFYGLAVLVSIVKVRIPIIKLLLIPYYFVFMNLSLYQGFLRYLRGNQSVLWEKAKRGV
ncbi:MAG: glycosyltransferase [Chitinophagales bacterium]|nr:glycosyltransferase [Chitinophagales bacterium]